MKLATRCIIGGALPYANIESTERMMLKFFEKNPFLPMLPNVSPDDDLKKLALINIPGVVSKNDEILLDTYSPLYEKNLNALEKAFDNPTIDSLEKYAVKPAYLEKFLQFITKHKPAEAYFSLVGPFTISQLVKNEEVEQLLTDTDFRELFLKSVAVKALWLIEKIKEACPKTVPVAMIDEPLLSQLGDIKRENEKVTVEAVTEMFTSLIEKIKETGALAGIQCLSKCDWSIPINAGADIISYDAYNNPNNLCIIPGHVRKFISGGGIINWCIIPVMTESIIKSASIESVTERLRVTMQGLVEAGVPESMIQSSAVVSLQGDVDEQPIIFAEKAVILATQLGKKIPFKL